MHNTTIAFLTIPLLALYLWRTIHVFGKPLREVIVLCVSLPFLSFWMFGSFLPSWQSTIPQLPVDAPDFSLQNIQSIQSANIYEQQASQLQAGDVPKTLISDPLGPSLRIVSPQQSEEFSADTTHIQVSAEVVDATDPNPLVKGVGDFTLVPGMNVIVVSAVNKDGHANSTYVLVKRAK
ncbi:hypothetical protein COW46_00965 [Candidatus Gracilibacteria bacterium CG17_big_fil_post_rev_8_21_14_2_50_48_13]|nr:MAG: hypothetical protein COW46_00965 [Candidatus Gracilibacteria bacterium CG17_big_fil_post_rev_8_21_14_2_50_48_13]